MVCSKRISEKEIFCTEVIRVYSKLWKIAPKVLKLCFINHTIWFFIQILTLIGLNWTMSCFSQTLTYSLFFPSLTLVGCSSSFVFSAAFIALLYSCVSILLSVLTFSKKYSSLCSHLSLQPMFTICHKL